MFILLVSFLRQSAQRLHTRKTHHFVIALAEIRDLESPLPALQKPVTTHDKSDGGAVHKGYILKVEAQDFRLLSHGGGIDIRTHCGGGVVVREDNKDHMKKHGRVVLLTATPETVYNRVKDSTERPILNDHMNVDFIAGLQEKRRALYEAAADVTVATDGKNPEEICREIVEKLTQLDRDTAAEQCK